MYVHSYVCTTYIIIKFKHKWWDKGNETIMNIAQALID